MTIYTPYNVFKVKHIECLYFHTGMACHLCLDPGKCLLMRYSLKVNKSVPQLHCCFVGSTSQLARSMCKSFCAPQTIYVINCNVTRNTGLLAQIFYICVSFLLCKCTLPSNIDIDLVYVKTTLYHDIYNDISIYCGSLNNI